MSESFEQLLEDLSDFYDSIKQAKKVDYSNKIWNKNNPNSKRKTDNADEMGYYCLQPLAVTKQSGFYDVIDGQQRLTTIYLIIYYLSINNVRFPQYYQNAQLYNLSYETRQNDFFQNKLFSNCVSSSNIDFYFISKAYETIKDWFCKKGKQQEILSLLLHDDYDINDPQLNEFLHDVRFIWYETPVSTSIKTFNNLNYGKIGLTASELVKALLFECDRYEIAKRDVEKSYALARSTQWSKMEEDLQNDLFWGMLSSETNTDDLHLELILSFVAQDIDKKMSYSANEGWVQTDQDWVFNIFSKSIADNQLQDDKNNVLTSITQRIDYLWNYIRKVYTVFKNWYDDRTTYHRIGLLVLLAREYGKRKQMDTIRELYTLYTTKVKDEFKKTISQKIGDEIRIVAKKTDSRKDKNGKVVEFKRTKRLDELRYGEDDDAIRKILLVFNVEMTIKQSKDQPRFPFLVAIDKKKALKSLEHIHPQHLDDDNIEYDAFKEWLNKRENILRNEGILNNSNKTALLDAISKLNKNMKDEKTFNANKSACINDLEIIDKEFDELAGMSLNVMHSIRNLALVDGPTNAALGNGLIDEKRQTLKERSENGDSYVPVGTWQAFNKHFSADVKDLKFWSKKDRRAYFKTIESVYNYYTKQS